MSRASTIGTYTKWNNSLYNAFRIKNVILNPEKLLYKFLPEGNWKFEVGKY